VTHTGEVRGSRTTTFYNLDMPEPTCPLCDGRNEKRPGYLCEECRAELFWEIVRYRAALASAIGAPARSYGFCALPDSAAASSNKRGT
jgi:hypothetical protein